VINPESQEILEARRKRRLATIWVLAATVVAGNLAGWLGFIKWGPLQSDPSHWVGVHASAFLFWIAVGMLLLCIRDLVSIRLHGSTPPTYQELTAESTSRVRKPANAVRRWMAKNQALVGAAGLIAGATLGHRFWTV
jgi:TRAP-type C4-dicarboxylate transport system permease small subunit